MNDMAWPKGDLGLRGRARAPDRVGGGAGAVLGGVLSVLLLGLAAAVAVLFAATLAVVLTLASAMLALSAVAWRVRPRPVQARIALQRRPGHAWIRYGREPSAR